MKEFPFGSKDHLPAESLLPPGGPSLFYKAFHGLDEGFLLCSTSMNLNFNIIQKEKNTFEETFRKKCLTKYLSTVALPS